VALVLAVTALAASRAAAEPDSVLCASFPTPPGAVYLSADGPTSTSFALTYLHVTGSDFHLDGTPGSRPAIAGIAVRTEANAQAVRDGLAPNHLDDVLGKGFSLDPPTPSVLLQPGPSEAMIAQFVGDLSNAPGVHTFSASQINNSNKTSFVPPSCGIGCCNGSINVPKVSHFTASSLLMQFNGNVAGCGIMIVDGDLTLRGTMDFQGLVIVRGTTTIEGNDELGLWGNATVYGSLWTSALSLPSTTAGLVVKYSGDALALVESVALPWCQPSICGDGVSSYAEQCDDGNLAGGDCCASDCTFEAETAACTDDGNACTDDHCDGGGACVHAESAHACEPCETCDPASGCRPAPAEGCRRSLLPRATRLWMQRGAEPADDRLSWTWRRGEATPPAAFGDPLATDDYALCIFGGGSEPALLLRASASPAGVCDGGSCWWRHGAAGFRYRDRTAPDGLTSIALDPGANGRARVRVQGRGNSLALAPLPVVLPLTVQLQSRAGACWEATYPATSVSQDARRLRGRGGG
jgi:cysteine-rich repeat protein